MTETARLLAYLRTDPFPGWTIRWHHDLDGIHHLSYTAPVGTSVVRYRFTEREVVAMDHERWRRRKLL